jgi:hypothetical protein
MAGNSRVNHRLLSNAGACLTRRIAVYEERRAQVDELGKDAGSFRLGALFPGIEHAPLDESPDEAMRVHNIAERLLHEAVSSYRAGEQRPVISISEAEGTFRSLISDGTPNDIAHFSYFPARDAARKPTVVILHHWNADPRRYRVFGRVFSKLGISAVVLTLPHHGLRADGAAVANKFLNADISQTIQSVMQSVLDVQVVVNWLKESPMRQVGVLGISLGSPIAALAAAFNPGISAAALLLTAGDFASVVWSGRATRHIRKAMDGYITLEQLQLLWSVISPCNFVNELSDSNTKLLILSGSCDEVVLPVFAFEFVDRLRHAGVELTHLCWPCGHYSLGAPPFSLAALARSLIFFKRALAKAPAARIF